MKAIQMVQSILNYSGTLEWKTSAKAQQLPLIHPSLYQYRVKSFEIHWIQNFLTKPRGATDSAGIWL